MQTICTSLQTDNHTNMPSLKFLHANRKIKFKKNTFFTLVAASAAVQRECAAERERAFRCSAPAVWNSLPQTDSVAVFKLRLKTFLFSQAFSSFSAHYHAA